MSEKKREIKLDDLKEKRPVGAEFLEEDEGYLDNLSEEELNARGGTDEISVSAEDYVSTGTYLSTAPGSDISIVDLD